MDSVVIAVGVLVLLYLGVMAGLLIYSNRRKDPDPGKKRE